jgi:hypothetical protein
VVSRGRGIVDFQGLVADTSEGKKAVPLQRLHQ